MPLHENPIHTLVSRPRGDRPKHGMGMDQMVEVPPHKWAVGTTFEWGFEFPITTNPAYEPEPASTRKTAKPANLKPTPTPTHARKASKAAPVQTTKPEASEKPKRVRLTPEQRQEQARARAVENRSNLKKQGLCRDCKQPAMPGRTRCTSCAENHRKSCRPRQSKRNNGDNLTS